jgi:hypothetical protein
MDSISWSRRALALEKPLGALCPVVLKTKGQSSCFSFGISARLAYLAGRDGLILQGIDRSFGKAFFHDVRP